MVVLSSHPPRHQLVHLQLDAVSALQTLSQGGSDAPSGLKLPPPHDIAMQTPPLHVGVVESVQSAEVEHVVITAAVATMVLPVKRIVKDIVVGSSTGTVDIHVVNLVVVHVDVQPTLE